MRLRSTRLPPADLLLVLPESEGELGLGKTQAPTDTPEPPGEVGRARLGVEANELEDVRQVADPGPLSTALPVANCRLGHAEARGEITLKESEIEPALAQVLSERLRLVRVTPWKCT